MQDKILSFIKRFRFPGIYVVLPGSWGDENEEPAALEEDPDSKKFSVPQEPALIVDTSALIDGRIADIKETGFMSGTFVVPSFVLEELHRVADSKDPLKRNRGRRGLDVLKELKRCDYLEFKMIKVLLNGDPVDQKLIQVAKRMKGRIITTDFNLNKVAKVSDVPILNVNELANMVKTVILPGEQIEINILKKGKEKGQGVGYLPDGTMVVVEDGEKRVGEDLEVEVERLLQTEAGKMIFAKPLSDS